MRILKMLLNKWKKNYNEISNNAISRTLLYLYTNQCACSSIDRICVDVRCFFLNQKIKHSTPTIWLFILIINKCFYFFVITSQISMCSFKKKIRRNKSMVKISTNFEHLKNWFLFNFKIKTKNANWLISYYFYRLIVSSFHAISWFAYSN